MITLEELSSAVSHTGENSIDTVVVAIADMQGRLQGKRFHAQHFVDVVADEGTEGCNYLLAVDVDMNTVDGYAMSSWAGGYGDFAMGPDLSTLRPMPWHPGSALGVAHPTGVDRPPGTASPPPSLRPPPDRLAGPGAGAP